jgi:hypothetical protein
MSDYIRPTSNPEGLCVSDTDDGFDGLVLVRYEVKPPLASSGRRKVGGPVIAVPRRRFFQACRDWARPVGTQLIRDGVLRIEEVFVFLDTGKRVPIPTRSAPSTADRPRAFLIRFGYDGAYVHMWRVTWEHVVGAVLRKDEAERARR